VLARIFGQNLSQPGLIQFLGLERVTRRRPIRQVLDARMLLLALPPTMNRAAIDTGPRSRLSHRRAFGHAKQRRETSKQAGGASRPHRQP
jgi:hypothetical protein